MQMQMQRIVQACENEVLGIIHRAFFDANYEVRAKVFDGLVVEPRAGAPSVKSAMAAAEQACLKRGWEVSLVEKPLHGLQTPVAQNPVQPTTSSITAHIVPPWQRPLCDSAPPEKCTAPVSCGCSPRRNT